MSKPKRVTDAEIVAAALAWVRVAMSMDDREYRAERRLYRLAVRAYKQRKGRAGLPGPGQGGDKP